MKAQEKCMRVGSEDCVGDLLHATHQLDSYSKRENRTTKPNTDNVLGKDTLFTRVHQEKKHRKNEKNRTYIVHRD